MPESKSFWPEWSTNKLFTVLAAVLIGGIFIWVIVGIRNDLKKFDYIGQSPEFRNQITLMGTGKVIAIPDIATVIIGMRSEKKEVADAQKENSESMNQLIKDLKKEDIEPEDLKTINYNIYPNYDYTPDSGRVLKGYVVFQDLSVKIRDLDNIGNVLSIAGRSGANQVSGVTFTIDDEEVYKKQAREQALLNAKEKGESLAKVAGVKLGKIISFSESVSSPYQPRYGFAEEAVQSLAEPDLAPEIEKGSIEITITATVTYEIL